MLYAKVLNGEVLEYQDFAVPVDDQSKMASHKPKWLAVEVEGLEFNPVTQACSPDFQLVIERSRVVRRFTVRDKNADDLSAMRESKKYLLEAEFQRLWQLPIVFALGQTEYTWHADQEAVDNIMGCLMSYREGEAIGIDLPDPREWTPKDSIAPVTVSRAQLTGLGLTIAARKDALFAKKKEKQGELAALTDPAKIDAYDALADWD